MRSAFLAQPGAKCGFGATLGKDRKKVRFAAWMQEMLFVWDFDKVLAKRAGSLAPEEGLPYMEPLHSLKEAWGSLGSVLGSAMMKYYLGPHSGVLMCFAKFEL